VKVTLWGTRGSLATPGPESERYGGNTACVEVRGDGSVLVLDAGTGIRRLGATLDGSVQRVDLLLTHLHMDHIQGLGFFAPLFNPQVEVHIWGPASTTLTLRERLARYLSPPLFPVHLRDVPSDMHIHEVLHGDVNIGPFLVSSALVCHPNPTVGYRIATSTSALAYLPDHEPALGLRGPYLSGDWTSGYGLAADADLLIHDAQYTDEEYADKTGWGHSSMRQAFAFAQHTGIKHLVPFHHDPGHSDASLDQFISSVVEGMKPDFAVTPGTEGQSFDLQP
jgi:phosphoribosyl 1,2-cyclic phosphodiesterase